MFAVFLTSCVSRRHAFSLNIQNHSGGVKYHRSTDYFHLQTSTIFVQCWEHQFVQFLYEISWPPTHMSNWVSDFNLNINDYKSLWLHYKIQCMFRDKEITVTQEKIACQDTITQTPSASFSYTPAPHRAQRQYVAGNEHIANTTYIMTLLPADLSISQALPGWNPIVVSTNKIKWCEPLMFPLFSTWTRNDIMTHMWRQYNVDTWANLDALPSTYTWMDIETQTYCSHSCLYNTLFGYPVLVPLNINWNK